MSKGVKKALGFVAAIFIPFAAPAIAGAIGMAGWLGSAAVGAGLGAANAALTGGNVLRGALFGGVGAGLSAGMAGAPMIGTTPANAASGVAGTAVTATGAPPVAAPVAGIDTAAAAGQTAGAVATAAPTATATTFMEAIKQVPSTLMQSLSDPTKLADLTLRAGSMLAAGMMTEDPMAGLPPEERQMVEMRKQELLEIQRTNKDLFDRQLALATDVMNEAKQYNPQYFAQQAANEQQVRGGALERQADETFGQGREAALAAEKRRIGLGVGRSMGSAFTSGLQTAEAIKNQKLMTASGLMPRSAPEGAYGSMLELYKPYKDAAASQQAGLQATFTDFSTRMFPPTTSSNIPTSIKR